LGCLGAIRPRRSGRAIHTDIEKASSGRGHSWQELIAQGSLHNAKESGAIRLEGKDYPVQDGDVIYFRFAQ
jgi:ribosome-binding ATPase YchF (GTP1/OBG family)